MTLTDTHAHLYWDKFNEDRDEVIARAAEEDITRILVPGTTLETSLASVELAEFQPIIFSAIGIHPTDALTWTEKTRDELEKLAKAHPAKVVAIGEIGLDYYWDRAPHSLQKEILEKQLSLAERLNLPIVLHLREKNDAPKGNCAADLLEMLEKWVASLKLGAHPLTKQPGVLHSFSGTSEIAKRAIALGFMIGVTGPITFKKMVQRREMIASLPIENLLIETDAPFLSPHPKRGKRNEPAYVRFVAEKIAEIHGKSTRDIAEITTANAARLFNW